MHKKERIIDELDNTARIISFRPAKHTEREPCYEWFNDCRKAARKGVLWC